MKTTSNRALGNSFESELCDLLYGYGFWTHNMAQNKAGQPADIIAARNGKSYLIDAKVCSKGFDLKRVEENQDLSMTLWKDCGNGEGWFALKVDNEIYMFEHLSLQIAKKFFKSLTAKQIRKDGQLLERWVSQCE